MVTLLVSTHLIVKKFFKGYGWFPGTVTLQDTTNSVSNRKYYEIKYIDDDEVCSQPALILLIEKQNIQIGEIGYEFVQEFEGLFYSGIVTDVTDVDDSDVDEPGIRICDLNYGVSRQYTLQKLEEWKDVKNSIKSKAYDPNNE